MSSRNEILDGLLHREAIEAEAEEPEEQAAFRRAAIRVLRERIKQWVITQLSLKGIVKAPNKDAELIVIANHAQHTRMDNRWHITACHNLHLALRGKEYRHGSDEYQESDDYKCVLAHTQGLLVEWVEAYEKTQ